VGEIDVLGASSAGFSLDRDVEVPAEPDMPTYLLDVRVGAGSVQVRNVPPTWDDDSLDDSFDEPTEEVAP
jgi:hypothetical protein